ncbi:hypothetical protein [Deinococcus soli (ex Cha et al. 2016)]|uniref:hypothetical protein n=1 Tax=Deinococcus soli (ex Cha et al. 2016) TaxID=1309411 RepID=UPI001662C6D2|nr:hypothetical protein [Deinococcus soli (ex Cha et al. 2016)]GGB64603.1 hypothetical protein GCM10008019_20890 [Deinococcus soli (ex Cha et al. 2016)]
MEDAELLQKAEQVYDKLLIIRADLYENGASKSSSPLHKTWGIACAYMREAGAVRDELKRRFASQAPTQEDRMEEDQKPAEVQGTPEGQPKPVTRAKFTVTEVDSAGGVVKFHPVYSSDPTSENAQFFAATPNGEITLRLVRDGVLANFKPGEAFYVDFTPAPNN